LALKIALACPYDWDAPGGVQVHVAQLAHSLRARGHQTLILTPGRNPPADATVRLVGPGWRIPYQGTVAPIRFSPGSAARVRRELRLFEPDVTHVHEPLTPSTAMLAAWASRAPVVATFHAFAERSRLLTAAAPLVRPVWRRLRVRLAVSKAAAGFVSSRFGDGIRIVPNGCDVELFAAARPAEGLPTGRKLLWVGRLDPQKGLSVALRAFAVLAGEFPDLWLVVAGDGPDRGEVRRQPLEVRERLVLLGGVQHERLPAYHAACDVFVSPAIGQESFGVSLVEAMAAGLPVVASDIAGYREVVRAGVDGLLVRPGDPVALAEEVRRVLKDRGLAERLRQAGRARADGFRWDVVTEQIEGAYWDAVGEGR
jgi:phosphatidylinositol alpha-mannosyltransferase